MKKFNKDLIVIVLVVFFAFGLSGSITALASSPAIVNLGAAGNFVILAKTGISTTGTTSIVGDIGLSPSAASYITGFAPSLPAASTFSTSALVIGKVYAPGYANPTPTNLTMAVLNMQTAYTDAAGRASNVTELGAGNIGGLTLAPGVYKWSTGVIIPTDITLSGGANDVWIFQIAQNLNISSAKKVILSGGAQAGNIFWVVAGQTTIGTTAIFNGNILDQTTIVLNTGARLNGRALAQSAVTLDSNTVIVPTSAAVTPIPTPTPTPTLCIQVMTLAQNSQTNECRWFPTPCDVPVGWVKVNSCLVISTPTPTPTQNPTPSLDVNAALQAQINGLVGILQSLQAQANQQGYSASTSDFGQQVRAIAISLGTGSSDNNVNILQQFLISQNKGLAAQTLAKVGATAYFGNLTRAALAEFQERVGISPALGNFGPITRAYLSTHY